MPYPSSIDKAPKAAKDLITALCNPQLASPFQISDKQQQQLTKLASIFKLSTPKTENVAPPRVEPNVTLSAPQYFTFVGAKEQRSRVHSTLSTHSPTTNPSTHTLVPNKKLYQRGST